MRNLVFLLIVAFGLLACGSVAESKPAPAKASVYQWGTNLTQQLSTIYPKSFEETLLNPSNIETDNEMPLKKPDLMFLRDAGIISSISEFCGLDWAEKNYLPIMQWQRSQVEESERNGKKIAMVGALHGAYQGQTDNWLNENNAECDRANDVLRGNLFADRFKL